jgi:hypothetical protein
MNFKRLLHTDAGRIFISIVLGLGLATLFRKVCKDKSCLTFNGPVISEIDGKVFKHQGSCYQYSSETATCDKTKRIVDTSHSSKEQDILGPTKNIYGHA